MEQERVAKLEGQGSEERGRARYLPAAWAQDAYENVDAQPRPVEVAYTQPLQNGVAEVGLEQEEEQVGRVEKAGLDVADEGRAAIEGRVPQRQRALGNLGRGKAIGGKEEAHQIAAVRGLEDVAADCAPEEARGEQEERASCEHVPTVGGGGGSVRFPPAQKPDQRQPEQANAQPGKGGNVHKVMSDGVASVMLASIPWGDGVRAIAS